MTRRLLNLVTRLSLLLSLASAVMGARSRFVDEAWESQPRCRPVRPPEVTPFGAYQSVWVRYYVVASFDGRFALATHERTVIIGPNALAAPPLGRGYMPAPVLLFERSSYLLRGHGLTPGQPGTAGGLPGVEWASRSGDGYMDGGGQFVAVSWLLFVGLFALPPAVLAWWRWRHRRRVPAFPVVTDGVTECPPTR